VTLLSICAEKNPNNEARDFDMLAVSPYACIYKTIINQAQGIKTNRKSGKGKAL